MRNKIQEDIAQSLKWSSLAEIVAKIITPISNMILARLLTPEAFGVVATVTMIISFADMFSDSGFQKFLVQHEFDNERHKLLSTNVAFTINLIVSVLLWFLIAIFNGQIAELVGSSGLGIVIVIAGISLPITSFSSIQSAIFRRNFDYKTLYYARIVSAFIPLVITVPLAFAGLSYWSLVIGSIIGNLATAIILTSLSKWKPKIRFYKKEFFEMIGFSSWSLLESLGTWLTSYVGTFIVGSILNGYYLGIYKTTMTTVNGIFAIVTSATTTVLFSTLSRLQNNKEEYDRTYLDFINIVSIFIIPLGVGIYIYKEMVTTILLGSQWEMAVPFVGIYGLMSSFTLVFGQYASEYYRGLGKPKANVLMTILHLVVLIPVLIICSKRGFLELAYGRSFVKIEQIIVFWIILWFGFKFNPFKILKQVWKACASALIMGIIGKVLLVFCTNLITQLFSTFLCVIMYFVIYNWLFKGKSDIKKMINMFTGKVK
ncbi:lipopolysaccharide biosynthesis protein [Enterococcus mundtii]|uniref:Lipopolysaccharide biosynthesis protein n=1 Tax=Enterococcus mundtii TaxID=53346 RepID=A0A2S7RP57_ENTMU|nr:lipopolysaccharide biosynthesis protein [Enterococcus mundtii]PQF21039.1 lipopolysaccharide biosynthesis protein [Enterococcus mundtii]